MSSLIQKTSLPNWKKNKQKYWREYYHQNKAAYRDRNFQRLYGISLAQYEALYVAQEGRCRICRRAEDILSVDHDHDSKKVRGLLCNACNLGLGKFADDAALLRRAAEYLDAA